MIHFDSQEKLPLELPTVQSRNKNDPPKKASKSSTNLNINPGRKKQQNKTWHMILESLKKTQKT